jgi:hypothetical protein
MKSENEIRAVIQKLFRDPLEQFADELIKRALVWVLGGEDEYLDQLLPRKKGKAKSGQDIQKARGRLFKQKPITIKHVILDRSLKWTLGEDDDFLDYLLDANS